MEPLAGCQHPFPHKLPLCSALAQPFQKTSCLGCLLPRAAQWWDHRGLGSQGLMYD